MELMSKHLKYLLKEYKEEYKELMAYNKEHYGYVDEFPDDELILCIAVREALDNLRKWNGFRRKEGEN